MPPSRVNGIAYAVEEAAPLAELPGWLRQRLIVPSLEAKRARPASEWAELVAEGVEEGRRDDQTAALAAYLIAHRVALPVVVAAHRLGRGAQPATAGTRGRRGHGALRRALRAAEAGGGGMTEQSVEQLQAMLEEAKRRRNGVGVTFEEGQGGKRKLILPEPPAADDLAGCCEWTTVTFNLDRAKPIAGMEQFGLGEEGKAVLHRDGAPDLVFEPLTVLSTARRLSPALLCQLEPTDNEPYGYTDEHARRILFVVQRGCQAARRRRGLTGKQLTSALVGDLIGASECVEGQTVYGNDQADYAAAVALRPDHISGRTRYLLDANTGEFVVRHVDLLDVARRHRGRVPLGWLNTQMDELGFTQRRLDGHAKPGRANRGSEHAKALVYHGFLPSDDA